MDHPITFLSVWLVGELRAAVGRPPRGAKAPGASARPEAGEEERAA